MNILTIYANPSPKSFCHAIWEHFSQGLGSGKVICRKLIV
jgi:putative NADPH-quinone reductase